MAAIPLAFSKYAVCWPKKEKMTYFDVFGHIFQGPRGPPGEIGSKVS